MIKKAIPYVTQVKIRFKHMNKYFVSVLVMVFSDSGMNAQAPTSQLQDDSCFRNDGTNVPTFHENSKSS